MNANDIELPEPKYPGTKADIPNAIPDLYTSDQVRAAIEADRKRRGEPILWIAEKALKYIFSYPCKTLVQFQTKVTRTKTHDDMVPLFTEPQPAEQVKQEPVGEACAMPGSPLFTMASFLASDVPPGSKLYVAPQPAEPMASPAQPDDFDAQQRRIEKSIRAGARLTDHRFKLDTPQPAEPVSTHHVHRGVESLPCYCKGKDDHPSGKETLEPVKVPSVDEIIELRSEFDWREHYGNIRFARALLERYGKTAD